MNDKQKEFEEAQKEYKKVHQELKKVEKEHQNQHKELIRAVQNREISAIKLPGQIMRHQDTLRITSQAAARADKKLWNLTKDNFRATAKDLPKQVTHPEDKHLNSKDRRDQVLELLSNYNPADLRDFTPEEEAEFPQMKPTENPPQSNQP